MIERIDLEWKIRDELGKLTNNELTTLVWLRSITDVSRIIADKIFDMLDALSPCGLDCLDEMHVNYCFEDRHNDIVKLGIDLTVRRDSLRIDLIDTLELAIFEGDADAAD